MSNIWKWPYIKMLRFVGWWPGGIPFFIGFILFVFGMICRLLAFVDIYLKIQAGNLSGLIINLITSTIDFSAGIRLIVILWRRDLIEDILRDLEDMAKQSMKYLPQKGELEIAKRKKHGKFIFISLTVLPLTLTMHWILRPFISALYGEKTSMTDWSFINLETWEMVILISSVQGFHAFLCLYAYSAFEGLFVSILEVIVGQFEMLSFELNNISYCDRVSKKNILQTNNKFNENVSIEYCIRHHHQLLSTCKKVKDLTSATLVTQCLTMVLSMCTTIFEITVSLGTANKTWLFNLIEMTGMALLHFFIICFVCNKVTVESQKISTSAYMSNWYNGNPYQKKVLNILITRSIGPIKLGGFIVINLSTFITVLKTGFSYYNFLDAVSAQ